MINSPYLQGSTPNYYSAIRGKDGSVNVYYNDPSCVDEEMKYTFNPDGSASSLSLAWGTKTNKPAGTFSDLMLKLPQTDSLNSEIAKQMAEAYNKTK
ncbi:hypothetical protein IJ596_01620 [bacterium]|nr:hypothetical protein [bacterium]